MITISMNRRHLLSAIGLVLLAALVGYYAYPVRAVGIPSSDTLTYSGTLQDDTGRPLTGRQAIDFRLWDAAEDGDGTERCGLLNPPTGYLLSPDGRFSITLPERCVTAVSEYPKLWVELRVAGSALPRAPLGAVPYAVEARRAVTAENAGGALEQRIAALEAQVSGKVAGVYFASNAADGPCATILNALWTDVPDATVTFAVEKPVTIWSTYSINVQPDSAPGTEYVATRLVVDDVGAQASGGHYQPYAAGDANTTLTGNYAVDLEAGSHTVKLQWSTSSEGLRTWANCPGWAVAGASVAGRTLTVVAVYR